jgi:hypothetical protein
MNQDQKDFLTKLAGAAAQKEEFDETQDRKRAAIAKAAGGLSDKDKEDLRSAMDFFAVDASGKKTYAKSKDGQEYALDSEAANRKKQAVAQAALNKADEQFKKVVKLAEKLREAKDAEGKPLFSAQEIADEVFTPLVREGILPENLVTEQYSEVQHLLGASFSRYKETLDEAKQDQEKVKAKTEADYQGAGSKLDMVKATGAKAADLGERVLDSFTPNKIGTKEERSRARDLASASYSAVSAISGSVSAVKDLHSGAAKEEAANMLAGIETESEPSTFFSEWGERVANLFDEDPEKANIVARYLGEGIRKGSEMLDEASNLKSEIENVQGVKIASASLSALKEAIESGKETGLSILELKAIEEEMTKADAAPALRKGVSKIIGGIDNALQDAVGKVNAEAGAALAGIYAQSIKAGPIVEAAIETEPDCEKVIKLLADGFAPALETCAPDKDAAVFKKVGGKIGEAFNAAAKPAALAEAIKADPLTALDTLLAPARKAAEQSLGLLPDAAADDPAVAKTLGEKLAMPEVRAAMKKKAAAKLTENLEDDLERSQEEIAEYERQLVLMDEAGLDLAQQKSIENLIAQLKADKKTLELVVSLSSGLSALGSSPVEIASKATEKVTEKLVGEIAGPLQAAKLIVQLSVNVIKAAERWRLWYKFRQNLELARKAGSALSSTIQGFYDNKKEQIAFHTIEDATIAVQIAGSVLGSIPEPITIAVGKTLSAVASAASAANTVANKIYDEVALRTAWATTKDAMNNPKDRSLGLAALRLNTTLAMHAIAWAGLEKRDPIARVVLDSCGLNENTLSDDGSTEKKVRQYLETLLDEDRKLMDVEKINTNWAPKNFALTPKDWVVVQLRGEREATPKLRKDDTSKILEALKKIEAPPTLETYRARVPLGGLNAVEIEQRLKEVEEVAKLISTYQPRTEDGSSHEEMAGVLAQFLKLANDRKVAMVLLRDEALK